jgi:Kef-type K+ transport system membrane component KefB
VTATWAQAALWLGLALVATLLSIWLRVATAMSEIVVGAIAQLLIGAFVGGAALGIAESRVTFLAGTGAIVLTFLAGAELDPRVMRMKRKEASAIGLVSFAAPFLGCTVVAYWILSWSVPSSWLAGIAMSTTSVAGSASTLPTMARRCWPRASSPTRPRCWRWASSLRRSR